MNLIKNIINQFHKLAVLIAKILIILMTTLTCVQVICRYIFNFSIKWSEEVPLIMMVWFGFISLAIGVKKKLHISIELFYSKFPQKVQKIVLKFVDLVILVFGVIMIVYGAKLASITMSSTMPATKMPTGFLYMIIPITGVFVVYDSFMDLLGVEKHEDESEDNMEVTN